MHPDTRSTLPVLASVLLFAGSSESPAAEFSFTQAEYQTVDYQGNFPADGSNNVDKFDEPGGAAGTMAPFTTTMYTRAWTGSTNSTDIVRRAQLYLQFDLTELGSEPVGSATLEFSAYSLNDLVPEVNQAHFFVAQPTNDWASAGDPDPMYIPEAVGQPIDGGLITSGTGTDMFNAGPYRNVADYSADVTSIVQNWQGGDPNHGFHIQLGTSANYNNGLGIDPATLVLKVETVARPALTRMEMQSPSNNVVLTWRSMDVKHYAVSVSPDLTASGSWSRVAQNIAGLADEMTWTNPAPPASVQEIYRVEAYDPPPLFFDDMESGAAGWVAGTPNDPPLTEWELGVPINVGPEAAYSPTNCWGTGIDGDTVVGAAQSVTLRSPPIDLSSVPTATLSFQEWFVLDVLGGELYDYGRVNIIGTSTSATGVYEHVGTTPESGGWLTQEIPLDPSLLGQEIMIEFEYITDDAFEYPGWYIDDVKVSR